MSAIVSGKASPHGKLEYILGGISAFCLILTTIWATVIIRSASNHLSDPNLVPVLMLTVLSVKGSSPLQRRKQKQYTSCERGCKNALHVQASPKEGGRGHEG